MGTQWRTLIVAVRQRNPAAGVALDPKICLQVFMGADASSFPVRAAHPDPGRSASLYRTEANAFIQ